MMKTSLFSRVADRLFGGEISRRVSLAVRALNDVRDRATSTALVVRGAGYSGNVDNVSAKLLTLSSLFSGCPHTRGGEPRRTADSDMMEWYHQE